MKNLATLILFFLLSGISNNAFSQDKGASTTGNNSTKIKARQTTGKTGKDDNCYLNGNGGVPAPGSGTTVADSTLNKGGTTIVPVPQQAVESGKKKAKDAGKSLINNASGGKLKLF